MLLKSSRSTLTGSIIIFGAVDYEEISSITLNILQVLLLFVNV